MNKSTPHYTPRQGSKIAEAIDALRLGPMTARELAEVLKRDCSAINTLLLRALTHAAIIRVKDQRGRLHFALPGAELNGQFKLVPQEQTHSGSDALVSSDIQALTHIDSEESHLTLPPKSTTTSNCAPLIAGLFADGELTISIGGECLQLNTTQRQQLYAYLHKIRYLE